MSSASRRHLRAFVAALACFGWGTLGCWEQWSNDWFPQMKWQPAVQAYERTMHQGRVDPFLPPAGTVPVDGGEAAGSNGIAAQADVLVNPQPMTLASLENGRTQYDYYCAPCHGAGGMGDGAVSMMGELRGPFAGILPIAGPASIARVRSDGHIFATIRYGRRRMPSYQRIQAQDRWDIVNYIRYLNEQRGVAQQ